MFQTDPPGAHGWYTVAMRRLAVLLSAALVTAVAACSGDDAGDQVVGDPEATTTTAEAEVRMNEVQALGSHNSYHLRPAPEVLAGIAAFDEGLAEELDYEHRSLTEQLEEFGIRQFELDIYADTAGGRFADRPAAALVGLPVASGEPALDEPGFKVLHQVDVDFGSSCLTLVACLTEIEAWSSADPDHEPVMILLETKQQSLTEATEGQLDLSGLGVDLTEVEKFTPQTFEALEAEIVSVFDRERIITPDDVRGDADTLEEAVLAGDAWPTLDEAAGKVLFALNDTGPTRDVYVGDAPGLEDRLLFTSSEEGRPDAAFVRVDDPVAGADRIADLVERGYLVRTRSDSPGVDAPAGDTTRRDAALASGAHYVSTDYYVEDPALETGFVVDLPGDAPVRCNPVNAPRGCDL